MGEFITRSVQVDILQNYQGRNIANYQEGGFITPSLQAEILQNSQEGELKTKITGIDIANFSIGGSFKPKILA